MRLALTLYSLVALCWFCPLISSHRTANEDATLSRSKDGFIQARLVPDLLPAFNPQGNLAVRLTDDIYLRHPGQSASLQELGARPAFRLIPGTLGQLAPTDTFTIIMVDPDSPVHANPSGVKVLLLGTGLGLDRLHEAGETYDLVNRAPFILDYLPPKPEAQTGIHRLTYLIYKGDLPVALIQEYSRPNFNQSGFNLTQFSSRAGFQSPYAGVYADVNLSDAQANAQANSASSVMTSTQTYLFVASISWLYQKFHL